MKNAVLFLALVVTVVSASGLRVAGTDILRYAPGQSEANGEWRTATGGFEDTVIIAYDDGTHRTWWCSDKDSFGAAVKFTPAEYPCQIVGARAEVGYDEGQQVYLRVFDDNGTGGLPGTVLYEQQRLDIPHSPSPGFKDYDLTAPVTIDSGDFYICFWQKHWFHLLFGSDAQFNYVARQWWYLPPTGWMTPVGMDAADHLIRARVLYGTGVEEELTPHLVPRLTVRPNPATGGFVHLVVGGTSLSRLASVRLYDATGRCVQSTVCNPKSATPLDLRSMPPGVYLVKVETSDFTATQKLVVQR